MSKQVTLCFTCRTPITKKQEKTTMFQGEEWEKNFHKYKGDCEAKSI